MENWLKYRVFSPKTYLFLFLVLGGFIRSISGQDYEISYVGLDEGLSQSSVRAIAQDNWGILWLGTQDGLNRYDGYEVKTFKNEPFDSTSLSYNDVSCILADREGRLWVGTSYGGLNLYDAEKQRFIRFSEENRLMNYSITSLLQDHRGRIWVGTSRGLYLMQLPAKGPLEGKVLFHQQMDNIQIGKSDPGSYIQTLYEDKQGTIWIGTRNSLLFIDKSDTLQTFTGLPEGKEERYKAFIWTVAKDCLGRLILSTQGRCFVQETSEQGISWKPLASFAVGNICLTHQGDVILGSEGRGLWMNPYDEKTQTYSDSLIQWEDSQLGHRLFGTQMVTTLQEDRFQKGNLWIGTFTSGMIGAFPRTKKFFTDHLEATDLEAVQNGFVTGLEKDINGNVWIIVEGGLLEWIAETGKYRFFPSKDPHKTAFWGKYLADLYADKKGNVWLATNHGLNRISFSLSGEAKIDNFSLPKSCNGSFVSCIRPMADGKLLLGMMGGYNIFDPEEEKFQGCTVELHSDEKYPKEFRVNDLLMDGEKRLWLSSSGGLFLLDLKREEGKMLPYRVRHFSHDPQNKKSLRTSNLMTLAKDHTGKIWISSMNGLMWAEEKEEEWIFHGITEKDGLSNNTVYAVIADTVNRDLWMSTNRGLCRLDLEEMRFDHFDKKDGLQGTEFNQGAYRLTADGEIFFGGLNGFSRFYPENIKRDQVPPQVWITELIPEELQPRDLMHGEREFIEMNYAHNSLRIAYVGINYLHPEKTQYAYRLIRDEREPAKWISNGSNRQVILSNLSPGNYTFEVKAANADGVWSTQTDAVTFRIRPPFWQTPTFFGIMILLIGGLLWAFHAFRVQVKVRRVQELERVRKNTAADFHDELGHKLTIISLFGEILKQQLKGSSGTIVPNLNKIIDTSNSLYYSMKDLLWVLDPEKDSILDLFLLLKDFGDEIFDKTGVAFRTEGIDERMAELLLPMNCKRHIALIFKEIMNNSLKHSGCKNAVLSVGIQEGQIHFSFSDDGKGFDVEASKSGHGLSNVHDRAKKIQGDLRIDSDKRGTVVDLVCYPGKNKG